MSRGNRRQDFSLDHVDRHDFLKTLAEACQKTGWQVHTYCLMNNHHHLIVETPNANLVAGMAWLQSAYTTRLNHRHKLVGHVLSGRYKAQLVVGSGSGYLRMACDYVHLNPARAGLLKPEERLLADPWSSFGYYLAALEHRPHCCAKKPLDLGAVVIRVSNRHVFTLLFFCRRHGSALRALRRRPLQSGR